MSQLRTWMAVTELLLLACGHIMYHLHYLDVEQLVLKCIYSIVPLLAVCMLTTMSATHFTLL